MGASLLALAKSIYYTLYNKKQDKLKESSIGLCRALHLLEYIGLIHQERAKVFIW